MGSLLLIGLFIGMRHALEADHVAAVAAMVNGKQSLAQTIRQGGVWGLGHTITLFLFGSIVIFMDSVMPEHLVTVLEAMVGFMLLLLGGDVLRRLIRDRVHFHGHRHDDGNRHFHAHSHSGERPDQHSNSAHNHQHIQKFPLRALFVGLMHGMAGSAAVIVLSLGVVNSPMQGLLYILIYGIGSMFGMALLSIVISLPLRLSAGRLTWMHNSFQMVVGIATFCLGALILYENRAFLSV